MVLRACRRSRHSSSPLSRAGEGYRDGLRFAGTAYSGLLVRLHVLRKDEALVDQNQGPPFIPFVESPLRLGYEPSRSSNLLALPLGQFAPSDRAQERPSLLQLHLHLGVDRPRPRHSRAGSRAARGAALGPVRPPPGVGTVWEAPALARRPSAPARAPATTRYRQRPRPGAPASARIPAKAESRRWRAGAGTPP